ncbi:MAG: hypothetical protein ACT4QD_17795 [Acidobacteriota bacterium]
MQRSASKGRLPGSLHLMMVVWLSVGVAGCGPPSDDTPAVASAALVLSHDRVAQGSPVEMTYRFQVETDVAGASPQRVFVHVVDVDEELMWTDDHDPPVPVAGWKAGQVVEYTRTMFAPLYPYEGPAKVILGVYDPSTNARLKLGNSDRGDRSYLVAEFQLLSQTDNVFLIFKDGWHPAETAPENPIVEWKWTKKAATLAFRNPRKDSTLILQIDNPSRAPGAASEVDVRLGDQSLGVLPVEAADAPVRRLPLSLARMGDTDMVEVTLVANSTFVPALDTSARSSDTRELGVRVFHAFVQPGS